MEKEYAIGIDLGGTSVKYALIDNEGVFYFQGKLQNSNMSKKQWQNKATKSMV